MVALTLSGENICLIPIGLDHRQVRHAGLPVSRVSDDAREPVGRLGRAAVRARQPMVFGAGRRRGVRGCVWF